jgi:hypothetical protein
VIGWKCDEYFERMVVMVVVMVVVLMMVVLMMVGDEGFWGIECCV